MLPIVTLAIGVMVSPASAAMDPMSDTAAQQPGSGSLTNDDIKQLVKGGLSDALVIARIRQSSGSDFDTSTAALVDLRQSGVSNEVIEAVITVSGRPPGARAARTAPPSSPVAQPSDSVASAVAKKPLEIRMDLGSVSIGGGLLNLEAGGPGQVAFALYLNEKVAIEPRAALSLFGGDASGGLLSASAFLPYYFTSPRSGVFVAPGVTLTSSFGELGTGAALSASVDFGYKKPINDKWTFRIAAVGGRASEEGVGRFVIGANLGVTYFIR